jgi:hypothetical protein
MTPLELLRPTFIGRWTLKILASSESSGHTGAGIGAIGSAASRGEC